MFIFTPEQTSSAQIYVPFIEDARADFAPYYTTKKTVIEVQGEIAAELGKLGGFVNAFMPGWFGDKPKRYGFEIRFTFKGAHGLIRVAGLPMRSETPTKKNQVAVQSLCIVRDWIKNMVTSQVFMPGNEPLMQFLLVDNQKTLAEYLLETGRLPMLAAPKAEEAIEGEVVN
jgi:hypothetical protein